MDTNWKKNLRPGIRFKPSDNELLKHYLLPKVKGTYIFPGIIHDNINVYHCHPFQLPSALDEGLECAYFFTSRERKFEKGQRAERCTKDGKGHWKMTSSINEIFDDIDGSVIGRKNTLVHVQKEKNKDRGLGIKTNWIMHEYVLVESLVPPKEDISSENGNDIVLFRIHYNGKTKGKKINVRNETEVCEVYGGGSVVEAQHDNVFSYIANPEPLQFKYNSYGSGSEPEQPNNSYMDNAAALQFDYNSFPDDVGISFSYSM